MATNFEKIQDFNDKFGVNVAKNGTLSIQDLQLAEDLISEEFEEVTDEFTNLHLNFRGYGSKEEQRNALAALAKELADLLYVTYSAADRLGIDINSVYALVHNSNLSKLQEDGTVLKREDGKVLKGPNYKPVSTEDIKEYLSHTNWMEAI